jgi:hypothetical protein
VLMATWPEYRVLWGPFCVLFGSKTSTQTTLVPWFWFGASLWHQAVREMNQFIRPKKTCAKTTPYQRSSGCNTRAACICAPTQALPAELLYGQSDHYVEYDRSGNIIKGAEKPVPRSKYEEDGTLTLAQYPKRAGFVTPCVLFLSQTSR